MRQLNPYTVSHVVQGFWAVYSLALVLIHKRRKDPFDLSVAVLLVGAWLGFAGIWLYVRSAGHAL